MCLFRTFDVAKKCHLQLMISPKCICTKIYMHSMLLHTVGYTYILYVNYCPYARCTLHIHVHVHACVVCHKFSYANTNKGGNLLILHCVYNQCFSLSKNRVYISHNHCLQGRTAFGSKYDTHTLTRIRRLITPTSTYMYFWNHPHTCTCTRTCAPHHPYNVMCNVTLPCMYM